MTPLRLLLRLLHMIVLLLLLLLRAQVLHPLLLLLFSQGTQHLDAMDIEGPAGGQHLHMLQGIQGPGHSAADGKGDGIFFGLRSAELHKEGRGGEAGDMTFGSCRCSQQV